MSPSPARRLCLVAAGLAAAAACFPAVTFDDAIGDAGAGDAGGGGAGDGGGDDGDGGRPTPEVDGDLGDTLSDSAVVPLPDGAVRRPGSPLALGFGHGCVIHGTDARVACWGRNGRYQLGRNTGASEDLPAGDVEVGTPPAPIAGVVSVVAGEDHTCLLTGDGAVYCFGNQEEGAVGNGGSGDVGILPVRIPMPSGSTAVSELRALAFRSCAVTITGQVYCWGHGDNLGDAAWRTPVALTPTLQEGVETLAIGQIDTPGTWGHHCALPRDGGGRVMCWGLATKGQCGVSPDGTCRGLDCVATPTWTHVAGAAAISAHADNTCAVLADGGLLACWGTPFNGQLGRTPGNPAGNGSGPGFIARGGDAGNAALTGVVDVSVGYRHVCAIAGAERRALCWGDPSDGKLGHGPLDAGPLDTPASVDLEGGGQLTNVRAIAAGFDQTCAMRGDGSVYCWGYNRAGVLGRPEANLAGSATAVQITLP